MHSLLHVDWLSVTIPIDTQRSAEKFKDGQLWRDVIASTYTTDNGKWHTSAPRFGYTHAYTSQHGTIAMVGQASMGLHVIYSGQALQALTSLGIDTERIIKNAVSMGGRATRIDVALDIIGGRSSVDTYVSACRLHEHVCASKTWRIMQGSEGGHTLYIGSRTSERMVRIYDKKAQMAAKFDAVEQDNWIRIECEFKGERARNLMKAFNDNEGTDVLASHLIDAVDFPTIAEYRESLDTGGKWIEPTSTKRKDTQTRHWLRKMVAPVIAREAAQDMEFYASLLTEISALIEDNLRSKGTKLD